jgi:hypothetical protein
MIKGTPLITRKRILVSLVVLAILILVVILLNRPSNPRNRQGLLVDAAFHGDVETMKELLADGASVDEPACESYLCLNPIVAAAWRASIGSGSGIYSRGPGLILLIKCLVLQFRPDPAIWELNLKDPIVQLLTYEF